MTATRERTELAWLSAGELRDGFRRRTFSPVEVVEQLRAEIERVDGRLNAFTTLAIERAAREAQACEQALMAGDQRPLLGVPVAVKDLIDTEGVRTTYGSAMFADNVPTADAAVVERLRQAGAIVIGKTATHEFAWGLTTDNPHFGPTRNPWDRTAIPGGSSGGSGVAVATGMAPIAIGTDTAGSIRLPAAFCGVAGLKPTYDRVSRRGVWPLAPTLDHVGPLARVPSDLRLVLRVLQGRRAPSGAGCPDFASADAPLRGVRVGAVEGLQRPAPTADVASVCASALATLEALGATRVDLDSCDISSAEDTFATTQLAEALNVHRQAGLYPARAEEYGSDVRARLALAAAVTLGEYLDAAQERVALGRQLAVAYELVDVIVTPCAATNPVRIDSLASPLVHQELRRSVLGYTIVQSLTGVPACVVRGGFDSDGMPVGVQLTGPHDQDELVLGVAEAFCAATLELQERRPGLVTEE